MPATGSQFSVEKLNFFKFQSIVRDDFPEAMRLAFKTMWDNKFKALPWDDSDVVREQLGKKEKKNPRKHMIKTGESYKTWDCTALVQATIFAFSFKDSTTGQTLYDKYIRGSAPPEGSLHPENILTGNQVETLALAVDQLRLLRNEIVHASSTKVDKTIFHYYIYLTKKAFEAIGYSTKNTDDIINMPEDEFATKNTANLKKEPHVVKIQDDTIERFKPAVHKFGKAKEVCESVCQNMGSLIACFSVIVIVIAVVILVVKYGK